MHVQYPWAQVLLCSVCFRQVYRCKPCSRDLSSRRTTIFDSAKKIQTHHRKYHLSEDDEEAPIVDFNTAELEKDPGPGNLFVQTMRNHGIIVATKQLVVQCCTRIQPTVAMATLVPLREIVSFLLRARLILRHGPTDQQLLSDLLVIESAPREIPLPTTMEQFSSMVLNPTHQNSFVSLIPIPRSEQTGQGHSYVPFLEASHHTDIFPTQSGLLKEKHHETIRAQLPQQIVANSHLPLMLMWTDGWDPSLSNKSNKRPIWSGTSTIVKLSPDKQTVISREPLTVTAGPGKASHESVFQRIREEAQLGLFLVIYWLADQPERRSIAGLLGGGSLNHACFGISCYYSRLERNYGSCDRCKQRHLSRIDAGFAAVLFNDETCDECLDWSQPTYPPEDRWAYSTPILGSQHPFIDSPGIHLNTHAGPIDIPMLKEAWKETVRVCMDPSIPKTMDHVKEYLKLHCINEGEAERLMNRCDTVRLLERCQDDNSEVEDIVRAAVLADHILNPEDYCQPLYPAMWDILSTLDQLPEEPMHLFMGIQRSVSKLIHKWAGQNKYGSSMSKALDRLVECHSKFARVDILPMARYSEKGKFPGWVADTFRSWCHLMPWFYDALSSDEYQVKRFIFPNGKPSPDSWDGNTPKNQKWTVKECEGFLRSRNIPFGKKLPVAQKQAKVVEAFAQPGGPPPIHVPLHQQATTKQIQDLVWYTNRFTLAYFKTECDPASRKEAAVYMSALLSAITDLDKLLSPDAKTTLVIAKYNFMGLARAVRLLDQFGCGRNLHAGGPEGEGGVKDLRPHAPKGLKYEFSKNLLGCSHRDAVTKQCQVKAQAEMKRMLGIHEDEGSIRQEQHRRHRYKVYRDLEEVGLLFADQMPLSVVQIEGRAGFGVTVKLGEGLELGYHAFTVVGPPIVVARTFQKLNVTGMEGVTSTLKNKVCAYGLLLSYGEYWAHVEHDFG